MSSCDIHSGDLFVVVGLARGITAEDEAYFWRHPRREDRMRCALDEEREIEPSATHVLVYQARDFDGRPTGQRHRMLLKLTRRVSLDAASGGER